MTYSIDYDSRSWNNTFQEPKVPWIVKKSFIRLHKLKERWFIAVVTVVAKLSSDSKVEEWDLNKEW